ncbi:MAG: alpha/beta hydrolase [Flavobacteriales bacterium]|nr:alpha/beta hydrolase [Flavobacteriales bacterium]
MPWTTIIIVGVILYILVNVVLYLVQERFLFKPEKLPEDFEYRYQDQQFKEYNLKLEEGVNINAIHFSIDRPRGILLYLKGNSRSIKGWGKFAVDFGRLGYDVVMVDYRGFGKSTGKRSEDAIKSDLQIVYDKIKELVPEKYIVVYGRSLGSGFAAKLASSNNPRMLILESPYYSMKRTAKRYLPFMPLTIIMKFPIRTYVWLKYVDCPIRIIHGTNDKLIPLKLGIKLSKIRPEHTRLYTVIGGGHNNLYTYPEYHIMLDEILNSRELTPLNPEETSLSFKRAQKKRG